MLTALNSRLSRWAMYIAVASLFGLVAIIFWSVLLRYGFNNAPPYAERVALMLVINVAMFGAAAGVRDEGHIGMESLVGLLPPRVQVWVGNLVGFITLAFAIVLTVGSIQMAISVAGYPMPILGISDAWRYIPCAIAGVLIFLFAIEHIVALLTGKKVEPSWH